MEAYEQRMLTELGQLEERLEKAKAFAKTSIDKLSKEEQVYFDEQILHMSGYYNALKARCELHGILQS